MSKIKDIPKIERPREKKKKYEKPKKTKKEAESDNFLFDDCPICQAMKKANEDGRGLSEIELLAAFAEAKKNPDNVVGFGNDIPKML